MRKGLTMLHYLLFFLFEDKTTLSDQIQPFNSELQKHL